MPLSHRAPILQQSKFLRRLGRFVFKLNGFLPFGCHARRKGVDRTQVIASSESTTLRKTNSAVNCPKSLVASPCACAERTSRSTIRNRN